jgi:hypothetical protein
MSYFPWETDVKKERHGRELIEVTAFINAVKKAAKSRNNVLMWHFSTSKEADRRRGTISVRKATHKELRPLEVHLKKNKIYARWGKVGRRKK